MSDAKFQNAAPVGRRIRWWPGTPPLGASPATELVRRPPGLGQRQFAGLLAAIMIAVAVCQLPFAAEKLAVVPGFIAVYSTAALMLDLLVGLLLLSKGKIEGRQSHTLLAVPYLYAGMVIPAHLLVFPGAFLPGIMFGPLGGATWLWVFWHGGFALLVGLYALLSGTTVTAPPRAGTAFLAAAALAAAADAMALLGERYLPNILHGLVYFTSPTGHAVAGGIIIVNIAAFGLVAWRFRGRSAEHLWVAVGMVGATLDVTLGIAAGQRYSLGWYGGRLIGLSTSLLLFVSLFSDVLGAYGAVAIANHELDRMTLTDPLTKLGNRRRFDAALQTEWRRCARDRRPLSVIMLDVDEFKSYNDAYGHQSGDHCLQQIGARLSEAVARTGDLAVRYGGEEFAFILPNTDENGALHIARRAGLAVRDMAIEHRGADHKIITISAGVACLVPSDSFDMNAIVNLADMALYRAKAAGRDTVALAA